jgi:hypothetical protein
LRRATGRLAGGIALLGTAALLGLVGLGLLLWGLYAWLEQSVGAPAAGAVTGAGALVIAGILAWAARRTIR